jgi:hypothetical protein
MVLNTRSNVWDSVRTRNECDAVRTALDDEQLENPPPASPWPDSRRARVPAFFFRGLAGAEEPMADAVVCFTDVNDFVRLQSRRWWKD